MKRRQFAWEDQRFSSKDTLPLASKLILPEDETEAALEISKTAGVFDQANEAAIKKLLDQEANKRARLRHAELEAVDEFQKAKAAAKAEPAAADSTSSDEGEPSPKRMKKSQPSSVFNYDSSDSEPSLKFCVGIECDEAETPLLCFLCDSGGVRNTPDHVL